MNNKYQEMITREVSRKDFLKFIGGGVIVLFGLSNFINYLAHFHKTGNPQLTQQGRHGFGSSKFGA